MIKFPGNQYITHVCPASRLFMGEKARVENTLNNKLDIKGAGYSLSHKVNVFYFL